MKPFWIISSISSNSAPIQDLVRYETEEAAIQNAKNLCETRRDRGLSELRFFILKSIGHVGTPTPAIQFERVE